MELPDDLMLYIGFCVGHVVLMLVGIQLALWTNFTVPKLSLNKRWRWWLLPILIGAISLIVQQVQGEAAQTNSIPLGPLLIPFSLIALNILIAGLIGLAASPWTLRAKSKG